AMSVAARSLGEAFAAIAGRDRVLDNPQWLTAAAIDGLTPKWIVRPTSVDQLGPLLALAAEARLPGAPPRARHAPELGTPPARRDVVLDLTGLDRVIEYNPDDLTITVQAGITAGALAARLDAHRQWLALDPPGAAARTVGGIAATNASGPLRGRYGTMRD